MTQVHQSRCGHKDDLHDPEADMRDGELPVVAHVLAAGRVGVADHFRALVPPHALDSCPQDEDPEDEEHGHPYLANDRREKPPVSHCLWFSGLLYQAFRNH
uniref:Uncharacterized protein n=1 Tax=Electrophorus electricus TaxID=8005 RepID=A0A4W4EUG8_ELEEL